MGVAKRVADWLRDRGHDVVHLRDQQLQRASDRRVFEKAAAEHRIILTFDLDFAEIIAVSSGQTVSAVIFRLRNGRAAHVIERPRSVLADSSEALEQGAIVSVEESRHRLRWLPIGDG
ncbi:MAG: DUF5615 family PIN-like protein [Planctomycetota bacterium]